MEIIILIFYGMVIWHLTGLVSLILFRMPVLADLLYIGRLLHNHKRADSVLATSSHLKTPQDLFLLKTYNDFVTHDR
jgi:hypothetical protein